MNRLIGVLSATFTSMSLVGCGAHVGSASNDQTKNAVATAIQADLQTGNVKTMAALPVGKSVATNFSDAGKFVVARKVANSAAPNCSKFDLIVSEPSSKFLYVFRVGGDSASATGVEICTPS